VNPWKRKGDTVAGEMSRREADLLRGLVMEIDEILRARAAEAPTDELAELTGIRTGPSTPPEGRILSRLLPDFHRLDVGEPNEKERDSAAALRSLHEPELVDLKTGVAGVLLKTCPEAGGPVRLTLEEAEAWLSALNDVRLALGTTLEVTEDMPEELPENDPRAPHLAVYQWLTWIQESLVHALGGEEL
jgi:Domain of unknown function (DUF2017)